jgi:predicted Zn-dependent protease
VLINARAFNAFVMDGRRIFVNVGALYDSKTPNEIIGVLAHEAGHIAGGHLSRLREQLAGAQTASIIALLLGAGAIAAGAATRSNNMGQVGAAAIQAPQEMIRRTILSYQRAQEESADRAAIKFLNATGQSAKGMHTTFKRFADDIMIDRVARRSLPAVASDAARARRRARRAGQDQSILGKARSARIAAAPRPDARQARGFPRAAGLDRAPLSAERHQPAGALCARDRGASLRGLAVATPQIDALIQAQPNNPYFHELKGQSLLEGARPAEAIAPLRRAAALAPNADADPHHARPGAGRDRRAALRRRGDRAAARRDAARAGCPGRLLPARHGPRPQG